MRDDDYSLRALHAKVDGLRSAVARLTSVVIAGRHQQRIEMAVTAQNFNDLVNRLSGLNTHIEGVEELLTQLRSDLEDAKDDPEQIQAILDGLDAAQARLAAAVANTPATPVEVPPEE